MRRRPSGWRGRTGASSSGVITSLTKAVTGLGLPFWALIAALIVLYVVLGCFLDGISIVVLTIAVLLPTEGFDYVQSPLRELYSHVDAFPDHIACASSITRAACSNAFDGMQPTFRQTPPSSPRSTRITFFPSCPARMAAT